MDNFEWFIQFRVYIKEKVVSFDVRQRRLNKRVYQLWFLNRIVKDELNTFKNKVYKRSLEDEQKRYNLFSKFVSVLFLYLKGYWMRWYLIIFLLIDKYGSGIFKGEV